MKRGVQIALLVLAAIAASSFVARAQDPMAKWKPSVGDRFVFSWDRTTTSNVLPDYHSHDTLAIVILNTDTAIAGGLQHAMLVQKICGDSNYQTCFLLEVGSDSFAKYPFQLQTFEDFDKLYSQGSYIGNGYAFDFSNGVEMRIKYGQDSVRGISTSNGSCVWVPELKWFAHMHGQTRYTDQGAWYIRYWELSLLSSTVQLHAEGVHSDESSPPDIVIRRRSYEVFVDLFTPRSMSELSLLDLLGRPIRSWQMPVEAGERRITLNVADVPNGVYFLRVQGGGVDEVKKVCIAH